MSVFSLLSFNFINSKSFIFQNFFIASLALFLSSCSNLLDKPLKNQKEVENIMISIKDKIKLGNYAQAIRLLQKLNNECLVDTALDQEVAFLTAQCSYKLPNKKENLLKGATACEILIMNYPHFSIQNDVYLLKIRLYFKYLDLSSRKSLENIEKIIKTIDDYKEKCSLKKEYIKLFERNRSEIEKIRFKCVELEIKKKLELGKSYLKNGEIFPALEKLTETISASENNNAGKEFAREAGILLLEAGGIMSKEKPFFNIDEKKHWKKY